MDPYVKDLIDAISKCVGLISVFVAIFVAWHQVEKSREERSRSRELREEELRWRKASLSRDILNEMWGENYCLDAMLMLDWEVRHYEIDEAVVTITRDEVWTALRVVNNEFSETERYIRDCFDHFFEKMQIIEHCISINLIKFEDVTYPFGYYAVKLELNKDGIEAFLKKYEYDKALNFLQRFKNH